MTGQYFSITSITKDQITERLGEIKNNDEISKSLDKITKTAYLWALWDIYPSQDISRPPIISGLLNNKASVIEIAKNYTLDNEVSFDNSSHFNCVLTKYSISLSPVFSYLKTNNSYSLYIWSNLFQYLINNEPIVIEKDITESRFKEYVKKWIPKGYAIHQNTGYARGYIKKQTAHKKSTAKTPHDGQAIFIEFLYSPREEWVVLECRWVWQRHRIVKQTERFIYVERNPYTGGKTVHRGWQEYISATCRIDKKVLNGEGKYWHKPTCKTFAWLSYNKKLRHTKFLDEAGASDTFDDYVIELPEDEIAWAVSVLNIKWPGTKKTIKQASGKLFKKLHADTGTGNDILFIKVKRARDLLLKTCD